MDEWIIINNFENVPGNIILPCKCSNPNSSELSLNKYIENKLGNLALKDPTFPKSVYLGNSEPLTLKYPIGGVTL